MCKRITCLILCIGLFLGLAAQAVESETGANLVVAGTALTEAGAVPLAQVVSTAVEPRVSNFRVNGVETPEDVQTTAINGVSYVSLRGMVDAVRPGTYITWDGARSMVWADGLCITAVPGEPYLIANGRYLHVPDGVKAENGTVMVPARTLAKALDATVEWDAIRGLSVTTGSGAIVPAEAFYGSDDLYWLSRIIYAESGNQPLLGQIAVGNVILNRVASTQCPNTIKGVVFQRGQFTPVQNGSINLKPSAKSVIAAKLTLDGALALENAMYFSRADMGSWMARNRPHVATIGAHAFYS